MRHLHPTFFILKPFVHLSIETEIVTFLHFSQNLTFLSKISRKQVVHLRENTNRISLQKRALFQARIFVYQYTKYCTEQHLRVFKMNSPLSCLKRYLLSDLN